MQLYFSPGTPTRAMHGMRLKFLWLLFYYITCATASVKGGGECCAKTGDRN